MSTATAVLDPAMFGFIRSLVRDKAAIVLDAHKSYLVESRLSPIVRAHGLHSFENLVEQLRKPNSGGLIQEVVEAMTTNETSFFRDLHPFEALKRQVLPALIARREKEKKLTIWSNACSTGQEAYSIAMLLREHFPQLATWQVRIVATDICSKVLERAKSGEFNQTEVNRGLPAPFLMKYFTRQGLKWNITNEIRNMVDFRFLNLVEPWVGIPPTDVVFLRNVLIYFDIQTKQQILGKVHRLLRSDGYLFLGGAESTVGIDCTFTREQAANATFYRPA